MRITKMNECLEKISSSTIEDVHWNGGQLTLSGPEFGMNFVCDWRLRKDEKTLTYSDYGNFKESYFDEVKKCFLFKRITGFSLSEFFIHIEPVVQLDDGYRLEVFSTDYDEPWLIRPGDLLFVANGTILSENTPELNESFISITPGVNEMDISVNNRFIENDALHVIYGGVDMVFDAPWRVCNRDGILSSYCSSHGENPLDFLDDIIAYRKSPNGDAQYFMKNGNVLECFSFQ